MNEYSTKYDHLFRRYAAGFFGDIDIDWRWFKAQGIAESELNPLAVSPSGAVGIMQLMPGTAAEMAAKLKIANSPKDPDFSIRCGIAYDRRCWDTWKEEDGFERVWFMFASYNAGTGNIIKAQKLAAIKTKWASVSAQLHKVTGDDDAPETINYVKRIQEYYGWERP